MFGCPTIYKPIIASMWDSARECWYRDILFITWRISFCFESLYCCFIIFSGVSMMSLLILILVEEASVFGTISRVISLLITSHNIECWKDLLWIYFVFYDDGPPFCCDGDPPFHDTFWCELWELHLQLIPSSLLLLWSELVLVYILPICWIWSTFFWNIFLEWMNPVIYVDHSRWS